VKSTVSSRRLFERAPVALVHVGTDGTIALANAAFARLVGGEAESVAGRTLGSLLVVPELGPDAGGGMAAAPPGAAFAAELRCADGTTLPVLVRTEGCEGGAGGCVLAVSERHGAEDAPSAPAAGGAPADADPVGLIAGGVAHHLNNYLATVVTNAALLAPRIALLPPDNGDFLTEITEAATHAAGMIRRLLAFSREQRSPPRPVALGAHLRALVTSLEREIPPAITVAYADRLAPSAVVRTDAAAIDRIVTNLVANAREAMPGGGALEIACEDVVHERPDGPTSGEVPPGRYVVLTVSDTGAGMDAEAKARVFEPFFTTKPDRERAGLGLAMVFGLARRLDGHVTVDSGAGLGTTVRVWLPRDEPAGRRSGETGGRQRTTAPVEGGHAPPAAAAEARHAILLVEDEVALRVAAQKVLERLGYSVYSAGDGEKALRLFHAHEASVGLVITDLMMPVLGGRGLYEALRAEGKSVPVVFTSGFVSADMRDREGLDPSVPFLEKPWEVPELVRVVQRLAGPPPARGS
jgi:two-component system cell cycle sensor histidine kinase/response regulator CckA